MTANLSLQETQKEWHGNWKTYLIGFVSSLILTLISFFLVATKLLPQQTLIYTIVGLALVQAFFQLRYFLHVGKEEHPRWEFLVFCCMFLVLVIIAGGSLWIMHDLKARTMPPMETTHD
ncbi:MAG: cytochrome o ubiquinol oxidase subunit IV [Verrucomicrobia bacterium]|nr:cytochrome o ubiquinol oxidase subunit IV [Verrucomicrobiota bacterium]